MTHESSATVGNAVSRQPHNNGNLILPPSSSENSEAREPTNLDGLVEFQNNLSGRMRQIILRFHDLRQKIFPVPIPDAKTSQESPTPSGVLSLMLVRFEDQSHLISVIEAICTDLEKAL